MWLALCVAVYVALLLLAWGFGAIAGQSDERIEQMMEQRKREGK